MGCLDFFLLPKQKNTYFYYAEDTEKSLQYLKYTHILDYGPMEESVMVNCKIETS